MASELSIQTYSFHRIHPNDAGPEVLELLERSHLYDLSSPDKEQVYKDIYSGNAQLWEFTDIGGYGIVITQIQGETLFIWRLIGKGLAQKYSEIEEILMDFGREHGTTKFQTSAIPWVGNKLMEKFGFSLLNIVVEKEFPNG